jgi:hypothetical protein
VPSQSAQWLKVLSSCARLLCLRYGSEPGGSTGENCAAIHGTTPLNCWHDITCAASGYCCLCESCPAGTYPSGSGSCDACPAGRAGLATGVCSACGAGTFAAAEATACSSCAAGTYASSAEATICTSCAAGSYSAVTGSTACELCRTGTFTVATSATSCFDECPAGEEESGCASNCTFGGSTVDFRKKK